MTPMEFMTWFEKNYGRMVRKGIRPRVSEERLYELACGTFKNKEGRVFSIVLVSILPHAKFGRNDHQESAPYLTNEIIKTPFQRPG